MNTLPSPLPPSPHAPIHKGGEGGPSVPPFVEGSFMDGCVGPGGAAGAAKYS